MNLEDHDYSLANKGAAPATETIADSAAGKATDSQRNANSCTACGHTDASAGSARPPHSDSVSDPFPAGIGRDNGDSHADGNADSNAGANRNASTPGLQLPGFPAEDGHPRRDQQSRPSALNAVGTPQGRYKKLLEDAIGSRWYYYTAAKIDLISIGTTCGDV